MTVDEEIFSRKKAPRAIYISDGEVAEILGVSKSTVSRLCKEEGRPKSNIDLRDCEPVVVGRIRRWRRDFVMLCLARKPVPTETWRKHHPDFHNQATAPSDLARLPADAPTPPTGANFSNAECGMQNAECETEAV